MPRALPRTGSVYDQGTWVRVAGLDTYVVRAGPQRGTPVVFLHGIPTSAFLYRDVIRALYEERDCIAFDWPGFGSSEKPRHLDASLAARADHLAGVLDALGLDEVDLVAHDVGGPAALLFAVRSPARVRRLVLLNTTIFKRDYHPPLPVVTQFVPGLRELTRPFFTRAVFDHFFKRGLARPDRVSRATLDTHWRLMRQEEGTRAVAATAAGIAESGPALQEVRAKMGSFPRPVLVLFGAEDPYLPPPNADRLARSFPHAEVQLLPGVGHFLQEEAPAEIAERIAAFLG